MTANERTFKLLVEIDPGDIAIQLQDVEADSVHVSEELSRLQELTNEERLPPIESRILHLRLLQAYAFSKTSGVPPEMISFHASVAAAAVANLAEMIRMETPEATFLLDRITEIERQAGLTEDVVFCEGEAPPEHDELSKRFADLVQIDIHTTLFEFFLRRYDMGKVADLLERDKPLFDFHRAVGMRVSMGDEVTEGVDNITRRNLGEERFLEVCKRAAVIRAEFGY